MDRRQVSEKHSEPGVAWHCFPSLVSDLGSIAEAHCISIDCILEDCVLSSRFQIEPVHHQESISLRGRAIMEA